MDSVASRYAIALLSVAREENKINEYVSQVEQLKVVFKENNELITFLKSYSISKDEKKQTLTLCFQGKIYEYILNLLFVLVDNSRANYMIEIFNEFIRIALNELNIKKGIVYSTISLSKKQMNDITKKVSSIICANVILENIIDKSLLGGFKIQIEDYILDDSLKYRLEKLKDELILKKGENN